jgi:dipeptidyl aminopeptidase/acylaminoacyl peptidase
MPHAIVKAILFLTFPAALMAQPNAADYERALALRTKYQSLAPGVPGPANWIAGSGSFWYRVSVEGGHRFVKVDAAAARKSPAFDHERLAAALTKLTGQPVSPLNLPVNAISETQAFADGDALCDLNTYVCVKRPMPAGGRGGFAARPPEDESPSEPQNDVVDGVEYESPQQGANALAAIPEADRFKASPDGKWEASIRNFNVFLKPRGGEAKPLSTDGSEGNYYTFRSLTWAPDSAHLVAYRVRPGYKREVHYVESSPTDQLQPKHSAREYAKPGDTLDIAAPVLFSVADRRQTELSNTLFPNAFSITQPVWRKSGQAFMFEYNQRGHQVYRVLEADAQTGTVRAVITEESKAFIDYRPLVQNQRDTGKKVRYDLADGKETIWMSERDGWAHLYLYDGVSGRVKNQITKGEWVVRSVDKIDEEKRQIWFSASGMTAGQDPYFVQYYRIDFDGTGLIPLTQADGNHSVVFSPDMKYYVDEWSRVDQAPVSQLRSTADGKVLLELEHADTSRLDATGWKAPESFHAKGRDGATDIWGVIWRPANFDASKKYPVVETIYAGPQGSFVPKTFSTTVQPLTELGFVVVQIDGMGTNNRSKAFHDVAFKNLKDAGFADRILWHKAVAAQYPWYDITKVGVFGTSAGGQNAMGALLFHPEFYQVAVSNSGCHDNRMDKIWWNEQWMSWPIGPEYAESSNVDNAYRLQGKLLLVLGEMDTNVDPASTLQVVNSLIHSNKKFDLLFVPGGGHGAGGDYGQRLLFDFFVHNLQGFEPPRWAGK